MGIGPKIKEYRTKAGLTQKELADKLFVTYQAVSRWENDDAEPSISTLIEMCKFLNCTTDELFAIEKKVEEPKQEEKVQIVEHVIVQEPKPVLAVCEECNSPIYESMDLYRIEEEFVVSYKTMHTEKKKKVLCKKCNERREAREKDIQQQKENLKRDKLYKRRVHSFIWPSLCAIVLIILAIVSFNNNSTDNGIMYLVLATFLYAFLATMILQNTFIPDLWETITSWGFVRLPGIIFEFSFDGLIFLITTKIILYILSLVLAILACALATGVAMALSIFVYPFALMRNFKGIES